MISRTTKAFWKHYKGLPSEVRRKTRATYKLWRDNPAHPSLFFKRVKENQPLYSVRVGLAHRAVELLKGDTITWFWVGNHNDYDRLIK